MKFWHLSSFVLSLVLIDASGALLAKDITPSSQVLFEKKTSTDPRVHQSSDGKKSSRGATGPQGEMGPPGEVGPMGPKGEIGPMGPKGEVGPMGPKGEVGPMGPKGEVGPMGPKGSTGAVGPKGDTGPQGPTGPTGPQGETGPKGETGDTGPRGRVGPMGPTGPQGAAGSFTQIAMAQTNDVGGSTKQTIPSNGVLTTVTLASHIGSSDVRFSSNEFTVLTAGYYQIMYSLVGMADAALSEVISNPGSEVGSDVTMWVSVEKTAGSVTTQLGAVPLVQAQPSALGASSRPTLLMTQGQLVARLNANDVLRLKVFINDPSESQGTFTIAANNIVLGSANVNNGGTLSLVRVGDAS